MVKPGAKPIDRAALVKLVQRRAPLYDKGREGHYNLVSALHKAVRGSDPDAALYYFCRMLDGGEDRLFIARRLVRMAVEDIGLADPQALVAPTRPRKRSISSAARRVSWRWRKRSSTGDRAKIECQLRRLQGCDAGGQGAWSLAPPKVILNAPTKLMEDEGYGDGYLYDHDRPRLLGPELFPRRNEAPAQFTTA